MIDRVASEAEHSILRSAQRECFACRSQIPAGLLSLLRQGHRQQRLARSIDWAGRMPYRMLDRLPGLFWWNDEAGGAEKEDIVWIDEGNRDCTNVTGDWQ